MTYANLPYPDLPTLPAYLIQNPYQRRPYYQQALNEYNFHPEEEPPDHDRAPTQAEEDERVEDEVSPDKVNQDADSVPLERFTHQLFSYDDPERTAFFVPLMILLVVHAMFLLYLHVYAPVTEEGKTELDADQLAYSLAGKRYYDVDGLKNSAY